MSSRFRALLPIVVVLVLSPALGARQGGVNKSLFVSVLDESGRPVRQFTADDVLIREGGQDRTVVEVKPASQPIAVAVLIDTAQGSRVKDAYGTPEEYVRDMRVQRGGLKNSKRDLVLNDYAKWSGGQRDFVVGISAVPDILRAYANALAMQYEVVYKRPENAKDLSSIQVGTRPGLKIHASGFPPQ